VCVFFVVCGQIWCFRSSVFFCFVCVEFQKLVHLTNSPLFLKPTSRLSVFFERPFSIPPCVCVILIHPPFLSPIKTKSFTPNKPPQQRKVLCILLRARSSRNAQIIFHPRTQNSAVLCAYIFEMVEESSFLELVLCALCFLVWGRVFVILVSKLQKREHPSCVCDEK